MENLFVVTSNGETLIEKHYRARAPRELVDDFLDLVHERGRRSASSAFVGDPLRNVPCVLPCTKDDCVFVHIRRNELFYLVVVRFVVAARSPRRTHAPPLSQVRTEVNPLGIVEFLQRFVDVLKHFFSTIAIDVTVFRDNFSTIYFLLDELADDGFPLTTEIDGLVRLVKKPTVASKLLKAMDPTRDIARPMAPPPLESTRWRRRDVSYLQNEVFVDVVERIDQCAFADDSKPHRSSRSGKIVLNALLSGDAPKCKLVLSGYSSVCDVSWHPCVRILSNGTNTNPDLLVVSFVPPDGVSILATYGVEQDAAQAEAENKLPVYCRTDVSTKDPVNENESCVSIRVVVGATGVGPRTSSLITPAPPSSLSSPIRSSVPASLSTPRRSQFEAEKATRDALARANSGTLAQKLSSGLRTLGNTATSERVIDTVKSFSPSALRQGYLSDARDVDQVRIVFPLSSDVKNTNVTANVGSVVFREATRRLEWIIGAMPASLTPTLSGSFNCREGASPSTVVPFANVHFRADANDAPTSRRVVSLDVLGVSYTPFKGTKYRTTSGNVCVCSTAR